ncbi:hypothetical protein Cni_G28958 [Canna indica]|uniref:GBF-interacting protein 1 N-terminal domain-containing protein n=1 Tax=Canna indica TaxID=4628 RepID=A0AAQ3L885_9LILI|nr:hypothetical protein Cni_G28958 [Canna indica]
MNGDRAGVLIPTSVRRMIQNIKEIVGHHSDEDVYANSSPSKKSCAPFFPPVASPRHFPSDQISRSFIFSSRGTSPLTKSRAPSFSPAATLPSTKILRPFHFPNLGCGRCLLHFDPFISRH